LARARYAGLSETRLDRQLKEVERETGFEPATFCLGSRHSAS
jgi:hypothetical protein